MTKPSPVTIGRATKSTYIPRSNTTSRLAGRPITQSKVITTGRSTKYMPATTTTNSRRSIGGKRLALEPLGASRRASPVRASKSITMSKYIPAESRRVSIGNGESYTSSRYGKSEIGSGGYVPSRSYNVGSAVNRIIQRTVN